MTDGTELTEFVHKYVRRGDLADVYPVQARRLSLASFIAAIVAHKSNAGVRFLTPPAGMFADRDVYSFFPADGELPGLIDLLDELRIGRNVTYRPDDHRHTVQMTT